jgi:two-component system, NarL family, nitrate/nitrite response regulator NarL
MRLTVDLEQSRRPPYGGHPIANLIQVLILQNQGLVGDALEALLNEQPDIIVAAKINCDARSCRVAASLRPDVVIIDFRANIAAAADVASEIRRSIDARIVVLTRNRTDYALISAIEAGASAIICESDSASGVIDTVRQAARRVTLIPPETLGSLLRKRRLRDEPHRRLTRRETEILGLMVRGVRSREIAQSLGIRYVTVRTHIRNMAVKLAAHSKLEVVAKAHQLELVGEASPESRSPTRDV